MTTFTLTPYLTDEMPHSWAVKTPLDALVDATSLHQTLPATISTDSVETALSIVFREANIGEHGWAGVYRDMSNRSLSVGDVVKVQTDEDDVIAFWVVMPTGFEEIDSEHVRDLLTPTPWIRAMRKREQAEVEA